MGYTNMGDFISDARKAKNMTQKDLAERLHVTDKAVSKWERGASCPELQTISKLAEALEVTVEELLHYRRQDQPGGDAKPAVRQKITQTVAQVLKAVGLAMGVATLALSALGSLETGTAVTLLAIGLTCVGITQLQD